MDKCGAKRLTPFFVEYMKSLTLHYKCKFSCVQRVYVLYAKLGMTHRQWDIFDAGQLHLGNIAG